MGVQRGVDNIGSVIAHMRMFALERRLEPASSVVWRMIVAHPANLFTDIAA